MDRRSRQVIHALSVDPHASMKGAFEKWGDALAAYRLLDQGRYHAGVRNVAASILRRCSLRSTTG